MDEQKTGNSQFTAQTTMLEALTADPSLGMVLMRDFHLGGCSNCGYPRFAMRSSPRPTTPMTRW